MESTTTSLQAVPAEPTSSSKDVATAGGWVTHRVPHAAEPNIPHSARYDLHCSIFLSPYRIKSSLSVVPYFKGMFQGMHVRQKQLVVLHSQVMVQGVLQVRWHRTG